MKIKTYNQTGEKGADIAMPKIFNVTISPKAVTQYFNYLRSNQRDPIANTKDRSDVSGGGKKPWRQKGTGNARAGSNRSPLWVGGGVTFGPQSIRNFKNRINTKLIKSVRLNIAKKLIDENKLLVIDSFQFKNPQTKEAKKLIDKLNLEGKIVLIIEAENENAFLSFRNIAGVCLMNPNNINMIDFASSDQTIFTKKAFEIFIGSKKKENDGK